MVGRFESNVLVSERTAADGIRFVLALLVTSSERQFVDEVHGSSPLTVGHDLGLEVCLIVLPDPSDVALKQNHLSIRQFLSKTQKVQTFNSLAFSNLFISL